MYTATVAVTQFLATIFCFALLAFRFQSELRRPGQHTGDNYDRFFRKCAWCTTVGTMFLAAIFFGWIVWISANTQTLSADDFDTWFLHWEKTHLFLSQITYQRRWTWGFLISCLCIYWIPVSLRQVHNGFDQILRWNITDMRWKNSSTSEPLGSAKADATALPYAQIDPAAQVGNEIGQSRKPPESVPILARKNLHATEEKLMKWELGIAVLKSTGNERVLRQRIKALQVLPVSRALTDASSADTPPNTARQPPKLLKCPIWTQLARFRNLPETTEAGEEMVVELETCTLTFQQKAFKFVSIFTPAHTNEDVMASMRPMFQRLATGVNCCILANGASGTGKSYTMTSQDDSIIYTAVNFILNDAGACRVQAKAVELIVGDNFRNLLTGELEKPKRATDSITFEKLSGQSFSDAKELNKWLQKANQNRSIAATTRNSQSSRGFVVYQIHCTWPQASHALGSSQSSDLQSVLLLVDLPGSERRREIEASDIASDQILQESKFINKTRSSLNSMIQKHSAGERLNTRDTKLNMLLAECFPEHMNNIEEEKRPRLAMISHFGGSQESMEGDKGTLEWLT